MNKLLSYAATILLAGAAFCLAMAMEPRFAGQGRAGENEGMLQALLGEGRRLFASQFFEKADVYFHSGYYPSIFDRRAPPADSRHMTSEEGSPEEEAHEKAMSFLGTPRDWVERFGRHFMVTEHTHLEGGNEREILPWLKLSADLDPQRVDTYTVAAYWLRRRLNKPAEAEKFLREGLHANPDSYEILLELGQLYQDNYHDLVRARNLWEAALRRWGKREGNSPHPDRQALEQICVRLGHLEEEAGNLDAAIMHFEMAKKVAPIPEVLQKQIDDLKQRKNAGAKPN